MIPGTWPSRFSDSAQLKKRRIPKEVRLNLLWARVGGEPAVLVLKQVWAAAQGLDVEFKKAWAAFKTTSSERRKTASLFTRVEARNERTAQRRSLRL